MTLRRLWHTPTWVASSTNWATSLVVGPMRIWAFRNARGTSRDTLRAWVYDNRVALAGPHDEEEARETPVPAQPRDVVHST
jgi:hypothetical protein